MESWYKEYCPKCETINWVCNGDESDLSACDIEGVKCRSCGHIWGLGVEICGEDDFWKLGLETPR